MPQAVEQDSATAASLHRCLERNQGRSRRAARTAPSLFNDRKTGLAVANFKGSAQQKGRDGYSPDSPFCCFPGTHLPGASRVALSATDLAKKVDEHYNRLQSLKTNFTEQYDGLGQHPQRVRCDDAAQSRGRMRWEYQSTAGKLFVMDGKYALVLFARRYAGATDCCQPTGRSAFAAAISAGTYEDRERAYRTDSSRRTRMAATSLPEYPKGNRSALRNCRSM